MSKCRQCKSKLGDKFYVMGVSKYCDKDCAVEFMLANPKKTKTFVQAKFKKKETEQRKKDKVKLKELRSRSDWFGTYLQPLVNQYNRDVIHAGELCYTCGNINGDTKMNAGHYIAVGSGGGDRRRFMHENIKRQCEYCNTFKSGAQKEYRIKLIEQFEIEYVEWLECESNHCTLKEQFPTWQDIEAEIKRYRELIRNAGLKPCR